MTKRINFNRWTTYVVLFSPFLLLILLNLISAYINISYGLKSSIVIIFVVFTVTILYVLQFNLGINFFKEINRKALFFRINGILALLFCIAACGFVIFHLPDYLKMMPTKQRETEPTPIFDTFAWVMLFHLAFTYFFVNNQMVRYNINRITDNEKKLQLKFKYLNPMIKIVRVLGVLISGLFIYGIIYFMLHPKVK